MTFRGPMKKNRFLSLIPLLKISVPAISLVFFLSGCVPKSLYDRDITLLRIKMMEQKAQSDAAIRSMEAKLQERSKTLGDITGRYIELEKEKNRSQTRLNSLKGDMESLLKDIAELKLVILANIKGTTANEMLIKLLDMEQKVRVLLGNEPN